MKKVLSFFVSLFIGIGLLIWVNYIVGWQEIKSAFLIFTGWHGIIILALSVLILVTGSLKWQLILKSQGYKLSQKQLFPPYLAAFGMNYLFQIVVIGGEIFRCYILKEKYSVPWKKAVSSIVIDKVLEGTCFLITILAGLAYFLFEIGLPPRNLGIIFGTVIFILMSVIVVFYFKTIKKESIIKPVAKFFNKKGLPNGEILEIEKESFGFFKIKNPVFWQALGLAVLRVVITWARVWILVLFLGESLGLLPALSVSGFYYIAMFVPIPADLGIHEVIQVFSFNALNLGEGIAPAFTMIQRGAQLILSMVGLVLFFKLGLGLLQILLFKKIENIFGDRTQG